MPLLEAMACNCPVVASDCSSIPEVCSDAAILVDPLDPGAFAEAISQVINNRTLRESLIEKGRLRINNFSWEKTARETIDLYNSLRR